MSWSHDSKLPRRDVVVSVIVPVYNAEPYISAAVSSILRERVVSLEVVVVNDRSTDRSAELVRAFDDPRIRLIDGPGRGAAAAMNAGYSAARGSIIMCCDADDYYPEARIARQVEWLQQHPEYDGICGGFSSVDEKDNFLTKMQCGETETEITEELLSGHLRTSYCTYAIRSTLLHKVGQFREFFSAAYDLDFQLRIGALGRIYFVPDQFYFYRIHSSSITHTQPDNTREFFEATAYKMHRQRLANGRDDLQLGREIVLPTSDQKRIHSASVHSQELLLGRAWREHAAGRKWQAVKTGVRALAFNPTRVALWKSVLALVLKSSK
jgi:glycosyltransferase involved in cell wall biosynthesis